MSAAVPDPGERQPPLPDLLARLRNVSAEALAAAQADDWKRLHRLLAEREGLMARAGHALATRPRGGSAANAVDPAPTLRKLDALRALDAEIVTQLRRKVSETRVALAKLATREERHGGYSSAKSPVGKHVDFRQ